MDVVRKNKYMFGNKIEGVLFFSYLFLGISILKILGVIFDVVCFEIMKFLLLVDVLDFVFIMYDMFFMDIDIFSYLSKVFFVNLSGGGVR